MRMLSVRYRLATLVSLVSCGALCSTPSRANLTLISHNATGPAYAVTRANGTCYAGLGGRLCVFAPSLELVAHLDLPSVIDGISVQGTKAYVATWFGGLSVIDLATLNCPQSIGTLSLPGQCRGLFVDGTEAYIASSDAGLRVVDISQVNNPTELGFYNTAGSAYDVTVNANYAHVADRTGGVVTLDVTTPSVPQLVSVFSLGVSQRAYDVDREGNYLYVAYGTAGLRVVDITVPNAPVAVGSLALPGEAFAISIVANTAYLTLLGGGLVVANISNPNAPSIVGSMLTNGRSYEAIAEGQQLYLADGDEALRIIDISAPSSPVEVSHVDASGIAADVAATGSSILVANFAKTSNGFRVLDAANPASIEETGRLATAGPTPRVEVSGQYVYLTEQSPNPGLTIAGIQDPYSPSVVSHLSFGGSPTDIDVVSGKAYLIRDQTMSIVNVQTPGSPTLVGTFVAGSAFDALLSNVTVSGTIAYLTDYFLGLRIVNVASPASPTQLGTYPDPNPAHDVAVSGSLAYLAMSDALRIVDISVPSSPSLISTLPVPAEALAVLLNGTTAYLCTGYAGVIAVDVSSPTTPAISGQYDTGDRAIAACLYYDHVVVADASNGIYVLADDTIVSASPIAVGVLNVRAYPNPFNPSTTVSFTLASSDNFVLQVFDVRGALVRTLANGSHAAGVHTVPWDGKDSNGRPVASGVYFCQLRSSTARGATKLVLAK